MRIAVSIHANTVQPGHIALVFDGARRQQCLPRAASFFWPVGDIQQDIVTGISCFGIGIPRPNRETQVVANERCDLPALEINDQPAASCSIMFLLTAKAEKMALVVFLESAARP